MIDIKLWFVFNASLGNDIKDAGGAAVSEVLKENKSITELTLETLFSLLFCFCSSLLQEEIKLKMEEERLLQRP